MPARHRSRTRAVQVLYQWDVRKQSIDECIDAFYRSLYSSEGEGEPDEVPAPEPDPFMETLARGTVGKSEEIDLLIEAHSANWRLARMSAVDRNLLRLAVYEMRDLKTPPAVVIDEALELAHRFSGDDSAKFVNGVLDAVRKQLGH
jgi:transcription antitermination protein NusB